MKDPIEILWTVTSKLEDVPNLNPDRRTLTIGEIERANTLLAEICDYIEIYCADHRRAHGKTHPAYAEVREMAEEMHAKYGDPING